MSITRRIRITIAGQVYDVTAELLDDHAGYPQAAAPVQSPASVLHPPGMSLRRRSRPPKAGGSCVPSPASSSPST